jgi:hypothetical protein
VPRPRGETPSSARPSPCHRRPAPPSRRSLISPRRASASPASCSPWQPSLCPSSPRRPSRPRVRSRRPPAPAPQLPDAAFVEEHPEAPALVEGLRFVEFVRPERGSPGLVPGEVGPVEDDLFDTLACDHPMTLPEVAYGGRWRSWRGYHHPRPSRDHPEKASTGRSASLTPPRAARETTAVRNLRNSCGGAKSSRAPKGFCPRRG